MSTSVRRDPFFKGLLRQGWSAALGVHALASAITSGGGKDIRVFYGGARSGDTGGPLVKVKRLRALFPEHIWRYNLVYTLSNTPYLPDMALSLIKRRHIPLIHNQNGVFYPAWFDGDWEERNQRMARSYHLADHVFYQSEFCKRASNRFLGERDGPGEILYNAVDTQHFSPQQKKERPKDAPFKFLLTGKIDSHLFYRLESSIRGLAEARKQGLEASLEIAGWVSGNAIHRAARLAEDLKIEDCISILGSYRQEEAPDIYAQADAYITTTFNDSCPNAVIEALSCGLPVLYSNSGGVPELVGKEAGIALPCEDSWEESKAPETGDIAEGMIKISENQETYSKAARNRAIEHFGITHWESRHRDVFTDLLSLKK